MNMIVFKHHGNFKKTKNFMENAQKINPMTILQKYGRDGVSALSANTPQNSGLTSSSWDYEIEKTKNGFVISWTNSNVVDGVPIAILIQYGHGTKNGGYVQGRDYINPVLQPIFDQIANEAWREVTSI